MIRALGTSLHTFHTPHPCRRWKLFIKWNILLSQLLHRLMHIDVRYYKHQNKGPRNLKNEVLKARPMDRAKANSREVCLLCGCKNLWHGVQIWWKFSSYHYFLIFVGGCGFNHINTYIPPPLARPASCWCHPLISLAYKTRDGEISTIVN
jgi:hypothetical protein